MSPFSLMVQLHKLSLDEHYARLYGPNMLVANSFDSNQTNDSSLMEEEKIPINNEMKSNDECNIDTLNLAFSDHSFVKLQKKKFIGSKFQQNFEDDLQMEMEKVKENKTKMFWNVVQVAMKNQRSGEEIETEGESLQNKIKIAYNRTKSQYKSE